MAYTGRKGWGRGIGGLCEGVGYMAGVGAEVEDLREVALDILEANMSFKSARMDLGDQSQVAVLSTALLPPHGGSRPFDCLLHWLRRVLAVRVWCGH